MRQETDTRPVPDPTTLTTEQTQREIAALKELVFMRLDGMDRAIELLAVGVNRVPSETTNQVAHLKELIFTRFAERDLRIAQAASDSKEALAAARGSADNAIAKAEQALNKRFDIADGARSALEERSRLMMPRSESEALHKAHAEHIHTLTARIEALSERGKGMNHGWVLFSGGIMLLVALVAFVINILKG